MFGRRGSSLKSWCGVNGLHLEYRTEALPREKCSIPLGSQARNTGGPSISKDMSYRAVKEKHINKGRLTSNFPNCLPSKAHEVPHPAAPSDCGVGAHRIPTTRKAKHPSLAAPGRPGGTGEMVSAGIRQCPSNTRMTAPWERRRDNV